MATTSAISSSSAAALAASADTSSRLPVQTLSQNDFLKLLTTQMSSQDPMNPKSDLDFTAQLAQFSALEQTKTMASDIAELKSQQGLLQASSMLGSTVGLQVNATTVRSGVVSSIEIIDGTPMLLVNGQQYDLSQVLTISPTPVTP